MFDDWSKPKAAFAAVPLFPLPNVVLLPRAVLPLHIFEERYKAMTAHALGGPKLIAMALLRPGWEKSYCSRPAIEPTVCVGLILTHEKLADGKYNFLLQGIARARIVREIESNVTFRMADLRTIDEIAMPECELASERTALRRLLEEAPWSQLPVCAQFAQVLQTPAPTPMVADLIAFHLLDQPQDVEFKQALLDDGDQARRVSRVIEALGARRPLETARRRPFRGDPSMN